MCNTSKETAKVCAGTLLARYEVLDDDQVEEEEEPSVLQKVTEAIEPESDHVKGTLSRFEKLKTLLEKQDWSHLDETQKNDLLD